MVTAYLIAEVSRDPSTERWGVLATDTHHGHLYFTGGDDMIEAFEKLKLLMNHQYHPETVQVFGRIVRMGG